MNPSQVLKFVWKKTVPIRDSLFQAIFIQNDVIKLLINLANEDSGRAPSGKFRFMFVILNGVLKYNIIPELLITRYF